MGMLIAWSLLRFFKRKKKKITFAIQPHRIPTEHHTQIRAFTAGRPLRLTEAETECWCRQYLITLTASLHPLLQHFLSRLSFLIPFLGWLVLMHLFYRTLYLLLPHMSPSYLLLPQGIFYISASDKFTWHYRCDHILNLLSTIRNILGKCYFLRCVKFR